MADRLTAATAALLGPPAHAEPSALESSPANLITFHAQDVGPPSNLYIGLNDQIQLQVYQGSLLSGGATTLFLDLRYLLPNGQIQIQEEQLALTQQGNPTFLAFKMAEGFLLSVTARISANSPTRGQVYVIVNLIRILTGVTNLTVTLARGYVSQGSPVCWPAIPGDYPANRPGSILPQVVGNPAAGVDWSITVPAGVRWRLMAARAQFATAIAAANRCVILSFGTGPGFYFGAAAQALQAASLTWIYQWGPAVTSYTAATGGATPNLVTSTPNDLWLQAGQKIQSVTQSIQAADQWSNINLLLEESLDQ